MNAIFVIYLKKRGKITENVRLPNILKHTNRRSRENSPDDDFLSLIEQSSTELGIPARELMQMTAEQIEQLARDKLINTKIEAYQAERAAINERKGDKQGEN